MLHFRQMTLIPVLLLLPSVAIGQSLQVLDISQASKAEVRSLTQTGGGWWLEMGKQMVLWEAEAGRALSMPVLASYAAVDPAELLLRARGCSDHAAEAGELLARGGRWELRRVPLDQQQALRLLDTHAWQPVPLRAVELRA